MTHECNLTKRLREAGDRKIRKFPTRRRNMLSWEFREEGFRLLVLVLVFSFRSHSLSNLLLELQNWHTVSQNSAFCRESETAVCVCQCCLFWKISFSFGPRLFERESQIGVRFGGNSKPNQTLNHLVVFYCCS